MSIEVPPEGYRKYPWAIGGISPPEKFTYEDPTEGDRATKAARAWVARNRNLGLRVISRKESGIMTVFFVKRIEVENE
jgi:hypothetical protein